MTDDPNVSRVEAALSDLAGPAATSADAWRGIVEARRCVRSQRQPMAQARPRLVLALSATAILVVTLLALRVVTQPDSTGIATIGGPPGTTADAPPDSNASGGTTTPSGTAPTAPATTRAPTTTSEPPAPAVSTSTSEPTPTTSAPTTTTTTGGVPVAATSGGPILMRCDTDEFGPAALTAAPDYETRTDPIAAGLRNVFPNYGDLSPTGWRLIESSDNAARLLHIGDPGQSRYLVIHLQPDPELPDGAPWRGDVNSSCPALVVPVSESEVNVTWKLDAAPNPAATSLVLGIDVDACPIVGARPLTERIQAPRVQETDTQVVITLTAVASADDRACHVTDVPSPMTFTVELSRPVGSRVVFDGGIVPAAPQPYASYGGVWPALPQRIAV